MVGQVAARRAAGVILEMIKVIGCGKGTIFEHLLLRSIITFTSTRGTDIRHS